MRLGGREKREREREREREKERERAPLSEVRSGRRTVSVNV